MSAAERLVNHGHNRWDGEAWVPDVQSWCPACRATVRPIRPVREPGCSLCDSDPDAKKAMPPHYASERCESGGHPHCSCDTCF